MIVTDWIWAITIGGFVLVIVADLLLVDSRPHVFGTREATKWVLIYVGAAVLFGISLIFWQSPQYAGEFFAGYLTEYSLSVDNLFVFVVLIASFAVPKELQHRVLLIGVVIALILRTGLIVVGAAIINQFLWVFFIFGAFLLWTAWKVWRSGDVPEESEVESAENAVVRFIKKRVPSTDEYIGHKLVARVGGRRVVTPMLFVVIAIGTTDLLFALDSIPAVFGLTQEVYIVFTVNAFALMGLRQLYFLLYGLLDQLIYLNRGLAIILGFIGIKLVLEAAHTTIDESIPTFGTLFSLVFIVLVLAITALWSIWAVRRNPELAPSPPGDING
ncbi:MAG: TerC/Alx family metal homeostasis membrane protein [Actinobacteria bacterium]|nr:TerC/Alx family metal homeostasis membrane protein [Actinomycetota bacterium]